MNSEEALKGGEQNNFKVRDTDENIKESKMAKGRKRSSSKRSSTPKYKISKSYKKKRK